MNQRSERRLVGAILLFSSAMVAFIMSHHPTNFNASALNAWVHGGMIGVLTLTMCGIAFSATLSTTIPLTRFSACLLFVIGGLLNILAASINGFALPTFVERFGDNTSPDTLALAWNLNQTLAQVAVVLHAIAMTLFATTSFGASSRWQEIAVRLTGLIAGLLSLGILVVHQGKMDVHTAFAIYSLEAIWICAFGSLLAFAATTELERNKSIAIATSDQ